MESPPAQKARALDDDLLTPPKPPAQIQSAHNSDNDEDLGAAKPSSALMELMHREVFAQLLEGQTCRARNLTQVLRLLQQCQRISARSIRGGTHS